MRLPLVRVTVAAGMAAGLLLSPNLWQTGRFYPTVPVWDGLPDVPPLGGRLVYGTLLALLALVAVLQRARWPVLAFVALAGGWSLWDQTRWQPWFYQYLALLAAVGTVRRDDPDAALNACRLVLAATYFWSGLQKVNVGFTDDVYPWLMVPVLQHLPAGLAGWAEGQGWAVAAGECGLGVALVVRPLRAAAVPLVVVMHAGLLFCLGPTGHNWNSVVWPWNLTLMGLAVVLFARTPTVPARHILWPFASRVGPVLFLLFGVMPAFSFLGWWDPYLSASLYSGNTPRPRIWLSDEAAGTLPPELRERHVYDGILDLPGWAIDELNVPGYPARRVFRGVARRLGGPDRVRLVTEDRPHWRTGEREEIEEDL